MQGHNTWISGITGRMGQELVGLIQKGNSGSRRLLGGHSHEGIYTGSTLERSAPSPEKLHQHLAEVDFILDFSLPDGTDALVRLLSGAKKTRALTMLVGTTGLGESTLQNLKSLAQDSDNKILVAPNTSLGIAMMIKAALAITQTAVENDFDICLTDVHHRAKKDRPSGTAKLISKHVASKAGKGALEEVATLRGGGVLGEHHLSFYSEEEEVTITHRAMNRRLFAKGALYLLNWLERQEPGFYEWHQVWLEDS